MRRALGVLLGAIAVVVACDDKKESPPPAASTPKTAPAKSAPSAVVAASVASAASSATKASKPLPGGPIEGAACVGLASALCAKMASCSAMTKAAYADDKQCKERQTLACLVTFGAPGAKVTPDNVAACAKKIPSASCDALDALDECMWKGTRALGAACGDDAQCETGFCDGGREEQSCGKCQAWAKEGEACKGERCAPGLVCASKVCAKAVAPGAACDAKKPCHASSCINGKCAAYLKLGDPCDPEMMKTAICDGAAGLGCDEKVKKCVGIVFAKAGEMCGEITGEEDRMCLGGRCADGKCVAHSDEGGPCKSAQDCVEAACVNGKCTVLDPADCK